MLLQSRFEDHDATADGFELSAPRHDGTRHNPERVICTTAETRAVFLICTSILVHNLWTPTGLSRCFVISRTED